MAMPFSIVDCGPRNAHAEATAVVHLRTAQEGRDTGWMQGLAEFLGLPVTAFAWPGPGGFHVRLFGPQGELDFSGPGLVASAHAVWHAELVAPAQPVLEVTSSGTFEARRVAGGGIELVRGDETVFGSPRVRTVARGEISWPS